MKFSFEPVHNLAIEKGYKNIEPNFTIENLIEIRKQFLTEWNDDYAERYPNLIFEYHSLLIKNEMFDAYFYWLLKDGATSEFEAWKTENNVEFENFTDWYNKNLILFSEKNMTNRFSYD